MREFCGKLDQIVEVAEALADFDRECNRRGAALSAESYWALWDLWVAEHFPDPS